MGIFGSSIEKDLDDLWGRFRVWVCDSNPNGPLWVTETGGCGLAEYGDCQQSAFVRGFGERLCFKDTRIPLFELPGFQGMQLEM